MYLQLWVFNATYECEDIHLKDASIAPYEPFNKPDALHVAKRTNLISEIKMLPRPDSNC
jgi:hypothetical protein